MTPDRKPDIRAGNAPKSLELFHIGDIVETAFGAKFWGKIVSFDDDPDSQPGATVLAIHPEFKGTKHVYPLKQLQHRPDPSTPAGHRNG